MAKEGKLKSAILTIVLLVLLVVVFILLGGGDLLKEAGRWITGMGKKAETIKEDVQEKATEIEKKVDTIKKTVQSGEKK
jgi:Sec-independent protein translocase protein TatA